MSETVIPLLSRRRDRAVMGQKLPHVAGAVVLLGEGLNRAAHATFPLDWVLASAEILTSVLVVGVFLVAVMRTRSAQAEPTASAHGGVDWIDLLLAVMFTVEAVGHHYETGHWPRPTLFIAATMLATALFHGPILALSRRRRGLSMSNKGLRIGHPLQRFTAEWDDLKPIVVTERWAMLETIHGDVHRIDLGDLGNERQIREALREAEVLRTARKRFTPKAAAASAPLREPRAAEPAPAPVAPPSPPPAPRGPQPPTLLERPTIIQAVGNKPKRIEEYAGRVNSGHEAVSIARMISPEGWVEPGQQPEFEEITLVLRGLLVVEYRGGVLQVHAGQAVVAHPGQWIRYSSPEPGGAEYVAICLPAFSPQTVHRDDA